MKLDGNAGQTGGGLKLNNLISHHFAWIATGAL